MLHIHDQLNLIKIFSLQKYTWHETVLKLFWKTAEFICSANNNRNWSHVTVSPKCNHLYLCKDRCSNYGILFYVIDLPLNLKVSLALTYPSTTLLELYFVFLQVTSKVAILYIFDSIFLHVMFSCCFSSILFLSKMTIDNVALEIIGLLFP